MKLHRAFALVLILPVILVASTGSVSGQTNAIEHRVVPFHSSSGTLANPFGVESVVFSALVEEMGAEWLRLSFRRVELSDDSFLRLTAIEDGATQRLHSINLLQWRSTSAYFNGSAVLVELVAGPESSGNVVEIGDIWAGTVPTVPLTQCGPTDDRVASNEPERARLLNVGCTAWLYNQESCFATAGHCVSGGRADVVQFNVPLSNPNGSINHPGPEDQYVVDKSDIPFTNGGQGNDWALFAVFPNTETGLEPYEVQGAFLEIGTTNPPFDDRISVVGYGVDSGTANQTQQTSFGPVTSSTSTSLRYRADTEGGSSGSGVVWEATGEAVAIHTHGGCTIGGGSNAGTATTHPGLQAALADFCPVGGGGGIECSDIHNFVARCGGGSPNNFLLMGVLLNDSTHNGETVTFEIDGTPNVLTVVNQLARLEMLVAPGSYEIELTDPAGCVPKVTTECF